MTDNIEMQETVVDGVTKYTIAFPLTDEAGQPILDRGGKARFTNLIAESPAELVRKVAESNLEVTRALDRANKHIDTLKNKKPTPQRAAAKLEGKPLTQEEQLQVGLDMQDPRKAAEAAKRVVESVVPVAKITEEIGRQGQTLDLEARKQIAREFFVRHGNEVANITANGVLLNKWLADNGFEFSIENLEIALASLEGKLVRPQPPSNDPPPVPSDANATPGNAEPNPGASPSPQRRAPVGGIRESQASGRPTSELSLTKAQALDMLHKNKRQYEEWMQDPVKNKILNRALAGR